MYNMDNPQDVQRFKINLMCSDVLSTIKDHTNNQQIGVITGNLYDRYVAFMSALRNLIEVSKPLEK